MAKSFPILYVVLFALVCHKCECSSKKGLGMAPALFTCTDLPRLTGISWWYDWAANGDKQRRLNNCTNYDTFLDMHVPMAWGNKGTFPNYNILPQAKYFLGFNEPNHQAQSNLTAQQAADLWPEVEVLATSERLIVSPAAAPCGKNCQSDNVTAWFTEFFDLCVGCRVDYIATHVYYCEPDRVMNYLEGLYQKFGYDIWVTEFACPGTDNATEVLEFMKAILPRLENAPYIFRYAWYISRLENTWMFVKPAVSLFEPGSPKLTTLGKYYNNFGVTTTTTTSTTTTTTTTTTKKTTTKATTKATDKPSSQAPCIQESVLFLTICSITLMCLWNKLF